MIPRRIALAGFLSYRDRQELVFETANVWLLTGPNGSGKSAIFDALTYALFGHHRGGSAHAAELINKDSHDLSVEFDFELDHQLFRIRRTLKRNPRGATSGTHQIDRRLPNGTWIPVPYTTKKAEFDDWIGSKIGLNYETFTASVLLLQGKAEKLLDARPSGRAEVLADVVDIKKYQRIHEAANVKRLSLKSKLDVLTHQSTAVPEVTDAEFAMASERIVACQKDCGTARRRVEASLEIEAQARRWADAEARLHVARLKVADAIALARDASEIESRFARWQELRTVLPAANTVIVMQARVMESRRKTEKYLKDRDLAQERKQGAETAQRQALQQKAVVERQLRTCEERREELTKELRELQGRLETVKLAEQQESELRRLEDEIGRLPLDAETGRITAQKNVDRLIELTRVIPLLERFHTDRESLGMAQIAEQTAKDEQHRVQAVGVGVRAKNDQVAAQVAAALQSKTTAEATVATARALLIQARTAAAEFATLDGARTCRACGQLLTAEHFAQEKQSRDAAVFSAEANLRGAVEQLQIASIVEEKSSQNGAEIRDELTRLRDAYRDSLAQSRHAAADAHRLRTALTVLAAELPKQFLDRISAAETKDWSLTTYPSGPDLDELRVQTSALDAARIQLREMNQAATTSGRLRSQAEGVRLSLNRLRSNLGPVGTDSVRQQHQLLQTEETALHATIKAARKNLSELEIQADKHGREAHAATVALTDLTGRVNSEAVTHKHSEESADRALATLPEEWRFAVQAGKMADYSEWSSEFEQLTVDNSDARFARLHMAQSGLAALREEVVAREADGAQFDLTTRLPADAARRQVIEARADLEMFEGKAREADRLRAVLESRREQRALLSAEVRRIDAEHNRYKTLAELLGRDHLQRHLVRQAERQIVESANSILDRLSGGQLVLTIVPGEVGADRALDLECTNRETGGPIPVAFLSGSQRFRVAVSLALGIGQYARQRNPIETIIIDEGFASLDREGSQAMIREIRNLNTAVKCAIVVSHQDEFSTAFSHGFRFNLVNGSTVVTRFAS